MTQTYVKEIKHVVFKVGSLETAVRYLKGHGFSGLISPDSVQVKAPISGDLILFCRHRPFILTANVR